MSRRAAARAAVVARAAILARAAREITTTAAMGNRMVAR
jgi:hypothetical protein